MMAARLRAIAPAAQHVFDLSRGGRTPRHHRGPEAAWYRSRQKHTTERGLAAVCKSRGVPLPQLAWPIAWPIAWPVDEHVINTPLAATAAARHASAHVQRPCVWLACGSRAPRARDARCTWICRPERCATASRNRRATHFRRERTKAHAPGSNFERPLVPVSLQHSVLRAPAGRQPSAEPQSGCLAPSVQLRAATLQAAGPAAGTRGRQVGPKRAARGRCVSREQLTPAARLRDSPAGRAAAPRNL